MTAPETFKITKTAEAANEAIPRVYDIFSEMSESVNGPPDDARALLAVGDIRAIVRHRNALVAKCEALERERDVERKVANSGARLVAAVVDALGPSFRSTDLGSDVAALIARVRSLEESLRHIRMLNRTPTGDGGYFWTVSAEVEQVIDAALSTPREEPTP